ncbi:hypothetical protein OG21DRAFT_1514992 [Imleria badia]|nr:hypothetical protein OG21DRAFT_1514992 [Imleria badia]
MLPDYSSLGDDPEIICIRLMLPKPSGLKVSPISIDGIKVCIPKQLEVPNMNMFLYTRSWLYLELCDNTHLRGFYRWRAKEKSIKNQQIMKFAIDMRHDPPVWDITCSEPSLPHWSDAPDPKVDLTGRNIVFDGLRGRLCYDDPKVDQIVVVEIE